MRPAMMLLLRALVILGAVLAVMSCRSALAAPLGPAASDALAWTSATSPAPCNSGTNSWDIVAAAGGTISDSGTGFCL